MSGRLGSVAVGAHPSEDLPLGGPSALFQSWAQDWIRENRWKYRRTGRAIQGFRYKIRPKASEKTRRRQNLPRNRIGDVVPFLANPTLELRHDLPLPYSAQFSPSIR